MGERKEKRAKKVSRVSEKRKRNDSSVAGFMTKPTHQTLKRRNTKVSRAKKCVESGFIIIQRRRNCREGNEIGRGKGHIKSFAVWTSQCQFY
jgi:hypothetical protein